MNLEQALKQHSAAISDTQEYLKHWNMLVTLYGEDSTQATVYQTQYVLPAHEAESAAAKIVVQAPSLSLLDTLRKVAATTTEKELLAEGVLDEVNQQLDAARLSEHQH
jgi:hypothetical protein